MQRSKLVPAKEPAHAKNLSNPEISHGFSLAGLAIHRPIFVTCLVVLILLLGIFSFMGLGVDLFPEIEIPVLTVTIPYRGAGPAEIETLVAKPVEDELSTIGGTKRIYTTCAEGFAVLTSEFTQNTDVKYAEQQVRDRVQNVRQRLPREIDEPVVRRISLSDTPVMQLALAGDLPPAKLYDLANEEIKAKLEQVPGVGLVDLLGGRKREIEVLLDRKALKARELSANAVVAHIADNSQNVPVGKVTGKEKEKAFRTVGEYHTVAQIEDAVINFFGGDVPVRVRDVARVVDGLQDPTSYSYLDGRPCISYNVYKQSGTNTMAVVDAAIKRMKQLNIQMKGQPGNPSLVAVRDNAKWIRQNVDDVKETIAIGILLVIVVVYFFLGNFRSMFITSLALPDSLLGAFIAMKLAGFTINIMTLLALSLAVGLLIDDAIVVRENIFRHIEAGMAPMKAALEGTLQVTLAVIATSLVVIAVFLPVGFLSGTIGKFLSQFGLTMCFIMAISLFDALTIAPMLSAYFAGRHEGKDAKPGPKAALGGGIMGALGAGVVGAILHGASGFAAGFVLGAAFGAAAPFLVRRFQRMQDRLEKAYQRTLSWVLDHRGITLALAALFFVGSLVPMVGYLTKTFIPNSDNSEMAVSLDLPPGSSLDRMDQVARQVEDVIRRHPEVAVVSTQVGNRDGVPNVATIYAGLVGPTERKLPTQEFKEVIRHELEGSFKFANPRVGDLDVTGGSQAPYTLVLKGEDLDALNQFSVQVVERLKKEVPGLVDVDSSYRSGKPEFQVRLNPEKAGRLGVSTVSAGMELRTLVDGAVAGKFREQGKEYDIRVRLDEAQRDLQQGYPDTWVPNMNMNLIRLSSVSDPVQGEAPNSISRQNRSRSVMVTANLGPGAGFGEIIDKSTAIMKSLKLPEGVSYEFVGSAEDYADMGKSMATAFFLAVCMMYLVLASLYESFITPFTILLALPLAMAGAFFAMSLVKFFSYNGVFAFFHRLHLFHVDKLDSSLNLFSWIGMVLLMGLVAKNSILLVDYTHQLMLEGVSRKEAIIRAGVTRLRPILMTSIALVLGTLPIALALSEAGRFRSSMGIAIVGGLVSSTGLTLLVVPAAFEYVDDFRAWIEGLFKRLGGVHEEEA